MTEQVDYKQTLNLPETDFPMKASLPTREPKMLESWMQNNLYQQIREHNKGKPQFILHDGPPYANGTIHLGHALNKILKDIIVRSKTLSGFDAPYVPGWDCHGLPIEHKIETTHGKNLEASKIRELCRAYATEQVELQKADFIRLGVLGDWQNPYITMNFSNEANEIRALKEIVKKDFVFKGLKPINWCFDCGSALAEAEVEYQDKKSDAIDVLFKAKDKNKIAELFKIEIDKQKDLGIVIWTTTPWTIPANQALNIHPEFIYALVETENRYLILASELVEECLKRYNLEGSIIAEITGEQLELQEFKHPFYDRFSPIYLADYVAIDSGTGIVHSAPAYGEDDFYTCKKYGMQNDDILTPVQSNGVFSDDLEFFGGQFIWKANPNIVAKLEEVSALMKHIVINHSYMHCWRHKTPLIYRATAQWFISMDNKVDKGKSLRENSLKAVDETEFFPSWGQARLHSMIANRPDWCISRQRNWGVPIPFFIHKTSGELHPKTIDFMEEVAKMVEKEGIDAWFNLDAKEILGSDAENYEKINDTLDVWFDSGTTHFHVMQGSHKMGHESGPRADLYLEGSDQHRGWFHSSLLTGAAINGNAPYKALLTHGFTVDEQGRKMSKSLGNVIVPQKVLDKFGADILRLWVASADYSAEISVSDNILTRNADTYRRIRNTIRFLLSNLNGFNPKTDLLPKEQMLSLDNWAVSRMQAVQNDVLSDYDKYQFWQVVNKLNNFCIQDLGGFYLDIIKDRQYTTAKNSIARKSAQSALYHITQALTRLIAPILPFTAEEIWQSMQRTNLATNESVMLNEWYQNLYHLDDEIFNDEFFATLISVKNAVNKELEQMRANKIIGSSLQAEVVLYTNDLQNLLNNLDDELRFVLITSKAQVKGLNEAPTNAINTGFADLKIALNKSESEKCERCWHYSDSVGKIAEHLTICQRCFENVFGKGEQRKFA